MSLCVLKDDNFGSGAEGWEQGHAATSIRQNWAGLVRVDEVLRESNMQNIGWLCTFPCRTMFVCQPQFHKFLTPGTLSRVDRPGVCVCVWAWVECKLVKIARHANHVFTLRRARLPKVRVHRRFKCCSNSIQ